MTTTTLIFQDMVNKVTLLGGVGKDPVVRHVGSTENTVKVAQFSLATSEYYKDPQGERKEQTEWHNIVAWRALAEVAEKYIKKGSLLYIEGKITYRKWADDAGNERYSTDIVANDIKLLSSQNASMLQGAKELHDKQEQAAKPQAAPQQTVAADPGSEDEDLPF